MKIIVQVVSLIWTKKSRGGELATVRSKVPKAAMLPSDLESAYLLHELNYYEANRFQVPLTIENRADNLATKFKVNILELRIVENYLEVAFENSALITNEQAFWPEYAALGIPARTVKAIPLTLQVGEWGRLQYNGRTNADAKTWSYTEWTYNIGYFVEAEPNVFATSAPSHTYASLANLR